MNARKLIIIVILAFAIKFWVFQPFIVTSSSMDSTLIQGDYLIVNKWQNSIFGNHIQPDKGEVIAFHYPLDKVDVEDKMIYIKRCVGVPGDTIMIENGQVNSFEKSLQFDYIIQDPNARINWDFLKKIDVHLGGKTINNNWLLNLGENQINKLKEFDIDFVFKKLIQDPNEFDLSVFPSDTTKKWNRDFYGPLYIPASGDKIEINTNNISLYGKIIEVYENHKLEVDSTSIRIDNNVCSTYTFTQDYYFMMGDNRHHSKDSRHWGFVPQDHLIANCSVVIFNIDNFSTKRLFKQIK
ncbi:MAG: signal peptidase I [Flavobacteriales bacterium]|nr:signal peptidase I [Flavobacteriales bacterium]